MWHSKLSQRTTPQGLQHCLNLASSINIHSAATAANCKDAASHSVQDALCSHLCIFSLGERMERHRNIFRDVHKLSHRWFTFPPDGRLAFVSDSTINVTWNTYNPQDVVLILYQKGSPRGFEIARCKQNILGYFSTY
jgi:hypothetical protein